LLSGPKAVLAYLARYTHRVAISNRRLIAADEKSVTFTFKDYRIEGPGRYKSMTLATAEFIRRFLAHVLPKGFHCIRHYGLFASNVRVRKSCDNAGSHRAFVATAPGERASQIPASKRGGGALPQMRRPHAYHPSRRRGLPAAQNNARSSEVRHLMIETNAVSSSPMADLRRRSKAGVGGTRLKAQNRACLAGQLAPLHPRFRSRSPWEALSLASEPSRSRKKPLRPQRQTYLNRHS
jgi:hypothetical protein